jgi:hypothetical protein
MRRRALLAATLVAAAAAGTVPARAAGEAPLPQRNLVVSWRWVTASSQTGAEAAVRDAGVVVGTGGSADVQGSVTLRAGSREEQAQGEQHLLVLNGGRAAMSLSQAVPLQWAEAAVGPRGGTVAVLRQGWVEAGGRVEVHPRWPGGRAPVTVDVVQQGTASPEGAEPAPRTEELVTTLQLPLDQWTTVAQTASSGASHRAGVLSSRDAERQEHRLLQMRVSEAR